MKIFSPFVLPAVFPTVFDAVFCRISPGGCRKNIKFFILSCAGKIQIRKSCAQDFFNFVQTYALAGNLDEAALPADNVEITVPVAACHIAGVQNAMEFVSFGKVLRAQGIAKRNIGPV